MRAKPLIIYGCFFLSGLAGLVYEVVWARQLALFLGITAYAHTAVITAYMAGLAAGSWYIGRRADRLARPLQAYAWLEIGVGAYAALTPWLFDLLQTAYVSLTDASTIGTASDQFSRLAIALAALLVPTFLMGGTLPVLVRGFATRLPQLGRLTAHLYGINTLGAMLGTLLAGFVMLPLFGVIATIFVGVAVNIGIALVVLWFARHSALIDSPPRPTSAAPQQSLPGPDPAPSGGSRAVILLAFATAGFAALLAQMTWIRALILVVGGSVYAFTITLASFLAGVGLGSLLYTRCHAAPDGWSRYPPLRDRRVQAALIAALISLTLLLGLALVGRLPAWFLAGYSAGLKDNFALFQLFIFGLCFSLMALPTLLMGALFPLVTAIWTRSVAQAGRGVGSAYAINTGGTILGALLGGLFILPWLGIQDSVTLAAFLYFAVAVGFWFLSPADLHSLSRQVVAGAAFLVLVATASMVPPWDRAMMVSGVFARPDDMNRVLQKQPGKNLQQIVDEYELLYYDEGVDGTVAVRRRRDSVDSQRTLVINGKADASSAGDMPTQVLLAQLPLHVSPNAERALVIGLGSGITAGSLANSTSLKDMTILEISGEVIEASALFEPENRSVLDDPRVRLVTADARNYLMAAAETYDLIVSEPSNPWISGIANLFTDEFLQLARSRLAPGGIMTQWFHVYSMSDADLKTMLKTFDDNFEYVSVWRIQPGDLALIGSDQPHALSLQYASQAGASELARAGVHSDRDLAELYVIGGDLLSRYARDARTNSDLMPVVEFSAPRNLYALTESRNMDDIFAFLQGRPQAVPMTDMVLQRDGLFYAPFVSLSIAAGKAGPTQINAGWMIDRRPVQVNGVTMTGTGSERLLSWSEGSARVQIRAVWQADSDDAQSLQDLLRQLTARTGRQGGTAQLADGNEAVWLTSAMGGRVPLQLDVAWDCPAESNQFSRYGLHASLPDPGPEAREDLVAALLGRISCGPPG